MEVALAESQLAINQCQLTEEIRWTKAGQDELIAVGPRESDLDLTGDDDVHRFSGLAQRAH